MLGCYQLVTVRKIRYVVCDSENTVAWFEHLTPAIPFSFSFKSEINHEPERGNN